MRRWPNSEKKILSEVNVAIEMSRKALKALDEGKTEEAIKAFELANREIFSLFLCSGRRGWPYGVDLPTDSELYRSATGITLATILLMQIGNLIGRRFTRKSGLDPGLFTNKLILLGISVQIVFSWATLYFPPVQKVLHTGPASSGVYALAWLGIPLIFGVDYLRKCFLKERVNGVGPS